MKLATPSTASAARAAVVGCALLLGACSTGISLTSAGNLVHYVSRVDMPTGCNLLGDVSIGIPPDAARPRTEEELVILMRNKAAELGGNYVLMDQQSNHPGDAGETIYSGRGVAYHCDADDTGPDPLTSGGRSEEPAEGGEGGGDEGGEEGGVSDEDLLGD